MGSSCVRSFDLRVDQSLILIIMDNCKCLTVFDCDDLNKKNTIVSVDHIDACETLLKELSKSLKIAKKFKEDLKLANLEKEELIVRLDESNKKNEFLRNQISSQDENMKSLEQELVEFKAGIETIVLVEIISKVGNDSVTLLGNIKLRYNKTESSKMC